MCKHWLAIVVAIGTLQVTAVATAQNLTVQQPVQGIHGVQTSVLVPDRGGAFLGGVSRAGATRRTYGPLRSGTSSGVFYEHSGSSAHVQIIDLAAMDEFLLSQPVSTAPLSEPKLHGYAANAYQQLLDSHSKRRSTSTDSGSTRTRDTTTDAQSSELAERSYRLGLKAEQAGRLSVARLHYRAAVRHGSDEAQSRLHQLDGELNKQQTEEFNRR